MSRYSDVSIPVCLGLVLALTATVFSLLFLLSVLCMEGPSESSEMLCVLLICSKFACIFGGNREGSKRKKMASSTITVGC